MKENRRKLGKKNRLKRAKSEEDLIKIKSRKKVE